MKQFPVIQNFDSNASDHTANQALVVTTFIKLRLEGEGMTWREMENLYKASPYASAVKWQKAYEAATAEAKKKGALTRLNKKEAAKVASAVAGIAEIKGEEVVKTPPPVENLSSREHEAPKPGSVKAREEKLQAQIAESKAKQPVAEITAQGEVVAEEIPLHLKLTVESFFGVTGEKAELLRALMKNDLALGSEKSIILQEIAKKAGLS